MTDVCETTVVDEKTIRYVKHRLSAETQARAVADMFKALADLTRIRIIEALSIREMCVCDLARALEMTQSAVSHQLRTLRLHGVVKYRKDGRIVYYSLDDEHVADLVAAVYGHASHVKGR